MNYRTRFAVVVPTFVLALASFHALAESPVRLDLQPLVNAFVASVAPPLARLVEAEVPTLGCPQDGQAGPQPAPELPRSVRVVVPEGLESALAFYSAYNDVSEGVLGPRGWDCFGTYGSMGSTLYVVPRRLGEPILERAKKVIGGPVIIKGVAIGGTSGRMIVAHVSARIFPVARPYVESVRAMGFDDAKEYAFTPWAADRLVRLADRVLTYVTLPGSRGLGTEFGISPGPDSIFGLAALTGDLNGGDGPDLVSLAIRLGDGDRHLYAAIVVAQITSMNPLLPPTIVQPDRSLEAYEGMPRGVIAATVTQNYKSAIEACAPPGSNADIQSPRFLACLKQQVRSASADLEAIYRGTVDYLKGAPDKLARLRQSERAWLTFQNDNCTFAKSLLPGSYGELAYHDCILQSTIERSAELRSQVGD